MKAKRLSNQESFSIIELTDRDAQGRSNTTYYQNKDSHILGFLSTKEAEERVQEYLAQEPLNKGRTARVVSVPTPPNCGVYVPKEIFYATFEEHTSFHNKYVKIVAKDLDRACLAMRDHFAHRWGKVYDNHFRKGYLTELCTITVTEQGGTSYSLDIP